MHGLGTGGKAVTNAAASTAVSTATLGFVETSGPFTPTKFDTGFETSNLIARGSFELAGGLATGAVSKVGKLGQSVTLLDSASNLAGVARGGVSVAQSGFTTQNTVELVGSGLGFTGNLPELSRFRVDVDPATLSSGPLALGGVKVKKVPNPHGRRGNAATQAKTQEVISDLRSRGFTDFDTEVQFIPGTGGSGTTRFVDVVGVNPITGQSEIIQIGRTIKSNNQIPVIRERRALDDVTFSPTLQERFPHSTIRFVDVNRPGVIQP